MSFSPRISMKRRATLLLVVIAIFSLLLASCGGSSGTSSSPGTTISLLKSGQLIVGSDTTYPPMESADPTAPGSYVGFDLDLINAIAQKMGLKEVTQKADFTTIFNDLSNKRFDIVISSVTVNPDRQKKFDFVPYFKAGESLLVAKGNPKNLKGVADLCGLNVGVQSNTVEKTDLDKASTDCTSKGKAAINQTVLDSQDDVITLLSTGRVVATYQDSPVTDYYNTQHPGVFEVGGTVVNTTPYGITVRKGETALLNAIKDAFKKVQDDGTYDKLFTKWTLSTGQKI